MNATVRAIDDDPVLGRYLVHYNTNRMRLLVQVGVIYAICTLVITLATAGLEGTWVNIVVPLLYALVAMPLIWYVAHLWNREVILFEKGFTFRQGSVVAAFPYENIVSTRTTLERIRYFGIVPRQRTVYDMTSDQGDQMRINDVYIRPLELVDTLERAILKARKPLLARQLARGEQVSFGSVALNAQGVVDVRDGRALPWGALRSVQVAAGALRIADDAGEWAAFPLEGIESVVILLALLKERETAP